VVRDEESLQGNSALNQAGLEHEVSCHVWNVSVSPPLADLQNCKVRDEETCFMSLLGIRQCFT
jgi:hypothetical protein